MAYDEELAHRIREQLQDVSGVREMKMFGGLAFLVGGNMAVAASRDGIMLRVPPEETDKLAAKLHAAPMVMRGKEMKGWLRVAHAGVAKDSDLRRWTKLGVAYARSLPPK